MTNAERASFYVALNQAADDLVTDQIAATAEMLCRGFKFARTLAPKVEAILKECWRDGEPDQIDAAIEKASVFLKDKSEEYSLLNT